MRLHHLTVTVPSQAVAREFYGDVLGLTEIPIDPIAASDTTWFRLGDLELHVTVEPEQPRSRRHFAVEVDDLGALRDRIAAAGGEVDDRPPLAGFSRRCFVRDPAGNRLELLERRG